MIQTSLERAARSAKDLQGGVVMRHPAANDRVDQSPRIIVARDQRFNRFHAIGEFDDAAFAFEAR